MDKFKDVPKYMFAAILAGVGAYGFINSLEYWQMWLIISVLYLGISKGWETVMN